MGVVDRNIGRISRPGSRFTAKRSLYGAGNPSSIRHNRRVGEVLHAYNSAHAAVFSVFWHVAYRDSHNDCTSLWHLQGKEKGQREFAVAYIKSNKQVSATIKKISNMGHRGAERTV